MGTVIERLLGWLAVIHVCKVPSTVGHTVEEITVTAAHSECLLCAGSVIVIYLIFTTTPLGSYCAPIFTGAESEVTCLR